MTRVWKNMYHESVLSREVIEALNVQDGKRYIDGTAGDGGHTLAIAEHGGMVLSIDQDEEMIKRAQQRIAQFDNKIQSRIHLVHGNFTEMTRLSHELGWDTVDGILLDLGVSNAQFSLAERGFSLMHNGPLDMRMDRSKPETAFNIINTWPEDQLYDIFLRLGEEHYSRPVARAIIRARKVKPIETTVELAQLIGEHIPSRKGQKIHKATKIFQAIRMTVNDERQNLLQALQQIPHLLDTGGRAAVISFHSGEDRLVKQAFQAYTTMTYTNKPIRATSNELSMNRKARSAILRIIEKI